MERKCPHCAELIKADANLCKHCKQNVTPLATPVAVVTEVIEPVSITTTIISSD